MHERDIEKLKLDAAQLAAGTRDLDMPFLSNPRFEPHRVLVNSRPVDDSDWRIVDKTRLWISDAVAIGPGDAVDFVYGIRRDRHHYFVIYVPVIIAVLSMSLNLVQFFHDSFRSDLEDQCVSIKRIVFDEHTGNLFSSIAVKKTSRDAMENYKLYYAFRVRETGTAATASHEYDNLIGPIAYSPAILVEYPVSESLIESVRRARRTFQLVYILIHKSVSLDATRVSPGNPFRPSDLGDDAYVLISPYTHVGPLE